MKVTRSIARVLALYPYAKTFVPIGDLGGIITTTGYFIALPVGIACLVAIAPFSMSLDCAYAIAKHYGVHSDNLDEFRQEISSYSKKLVAGPIQLAIK